MTQTFIISHYRKTTSDFYVNGGKLTVTDSEITLIMPLKRTESFKVSELRASVQPDDLFFKVICLSDSRKSYDLLVTKRTFNNLCDTLRSMNLLI